MLLIFCFDVVDWFLPIFHLLLLFFLAVSVISNIDLFRSVVVVGASTLLQQAIGTVAENLAFGTLGSMSFTSAEF